MPEDVGKLKYFRHQNFSRKQKNVRLVRRNHAERKHGLTVQMPQYTVMNCGGAASVEMELESKRCV